MPGYAAGVGRIGEGSRLLVTAGVLWRTLTTENYRTFVQRHCDFYANPRTVEYMIEVLGELVGKIFPDAEVTIVHDEKVSIDPRPKWANRLVGASLVDGTDRNGQNIALITGDSAADLLLLAHNDALGIGLFGLEQALASRHPHVFVVNGRRRIYRLDAVARHTLTRRRFLAQTRLVELGLSCYIFAAAGYWRLTSRLRR